MKKGFGNHLQATQSPVTRLSETLRDLLLQGCWHAEVAALHGCTDICGTRPGHYNDSATLLLPRCRLVLHTATPQNWFLRLFESTGSAAHVATIMERVRSLPEHGSRAS